MQSETSFGDHNRGVQIGPTSIRAVGSLEQSLHLGVITYLAKSSSVGIAAGRLLLTESPQHPASLIREQRRDGDVLNCLTHSSLARNAPDVWESVKLFFNE